MKNWFQKKIKWVAFMLSLIFLGLGMYTLDTITSVFFLVLAFFLWMGIFYQRVSEVGEMFKKLSPLEKKIYCDRNYHYDKKEMQRAGNLGVQSFIIFFGVVIWNKGGATQDGALLGFLSLFFALLHLISFLVTSKSVSRYERMAKAS